MSSGAAPDTASSYRWANSARLAPGTGPGSTMNPSACNAYAVSDDSCVFAEIDANQLSISARPERYGPPGSPHYGSTTRNSFETESHVSTWTYNARSLSEAARPRTIGEKR